MHGLRKGIQDRHRRSGGLLLFRHQPRVGLGQAAGQPHRPDALPGGTPRSRASTPRTAKKSSACATTKQPFSARVFKTLADPFVGKLSPDEGHLRRADQRNRRSTTPTRKRPRRQARSTSCAARSRPRPPASWPATSAPSRSCRPSPPATPCATRTTRSSSPSWSSRLPASPWPCTPRRPARKTRSSPAWPA